MINVLVKLKNCWIGEFFLCGSRYGPPDYDKETKGKKCKKAKRQKDKKVKKTKWQRIKNTERQKDKNTKRLKD